MSAIHGVRLEGCRTTPLASYLKALGVLRIVSEQADHEARGWWSGSTFHLDSQLDAAGVKEFFLREYRPTPVLGPWNGGSGFYPKDALGIRTLAAIAEGGTERLREVRDAIAFARTLVKQMGYTQRPEKEEKARFVTELRSTARGGFLKWIDAAIALGTDDLHFPPLLGSGGNDGRLDFTVNFLLNQSIVIDPASGAPTDEGEPLLSAALFAKSIPGLKGNAIGQFAPGGAGGPNASSGFDGSPKMNPWDFLLMIEGAILFASSAVRRLEASGTSVLAYPFTVRPTGAGAIGTAPSDGKSARAEMWLPVWNSPCRLSELERVFQEGRLVVGDRSARDGLDVARAVAGLGVDRGIDALERYAFMQRSGNAYLATPLGQVRVRRRPEADLIGDLEAGGWLRRFRGLASGKNAPARLSSIGRQLEDTLFDLARSDHPQTAALKVLVTLGECQAYLTSSPASQEACRPVPALTPTWAALADDGSPEFAVATALADLHGRGPPIRDASDPEGGSRAGPFVLRTAEYISPVTHKRRGWEWTEGKGHRVVWSDGSILANIARMAQRRLLDADELGLVEAPFKATMGLPISIAVRWIEAPNWDQRIATLVRGLALVAGAKPKRRWESAVGVPFPAAFPLLKPYFTPAAMLNEALGAARNSEGEAWAAVGPPPAHRIVRLLSADRAGDAVAMAHRELRARGMPVPRTRPSCDSFDGRRLLAALVLPLYQKHLGFALSRYFRSGPMRPTSLVSSKDED